MESRAVSKAGSRARGLGELGTGVPGILGPVPALFSLGPGFLVEEGQKSPAPTPRLPMAWEHTALVIQKDLLRPGSLYTLSCVESAGPGHPAGIYL